MENKELYWAQEGLQFRDLFLLRDYLIENTVKSSFQKNKMLEKVNYTIDKTLERLCGMEVK